MRFAALVALLFVACATVDATRLFRSGTAALDRGDASGAVRDLEAAAELLPESSAVQNHLGLAYAAGGRDADALHITSVRGRMQSTRVRATPCAHTDNSQDVTP